MANVKYKNWRGQEVTVQDITSITLKDENDNDVTFSLGTPYTIRVAELPNVTITVDGVSKTSAGGVTEFSTTLGSHTVTVSNGGTTIWTATVNITDVGAVYAKGRDINTLSWAEIHQTCQGGYAEHMFNIFDQKTYVDTNSIFNNYAFYIQHFFKVQGKTQIQWGMANCYSVNYSINPRYYWVTAADVWQTDTGNQNYSSEGGWKYCVLRNNFLPAGTEVINQCQSLKPDTSTQTDGIAWSDYKYTDTQERAKFYVYNVSADTATATETMDEITEWQVPPGNNIPLFVAGYWKNCGTLTQEQFNTGRYYTYADNHYTPASSYVSGTTYYGFYKTLQEDGIFYGALKGIESYLAEMELKQSPGRTRKKAIQICYDKVTIPSLGELMGQYIQGETPVSSIKAPSYYGDPVGCNEQFDAGRECKSWYLYQNLWTRSAYSDKSASFCYLYSAGNVANNIVYNSFRVRAGFRFL